MRTLLLFLVCLVAVSCSENNAGGGGGNGSGSGAGGGGTTNPPAVTATGGEHTDTSGNVVSEFAVELEIENEEDLDSRRKKVWDALSEGKKFKFEDLTAALIERQAERHEIPDVKPEKFENLVTSILPKEYKGVDHSGEYKKAYEAKLLDKLKEDHGIEKLQYHSGYSNIFDLFSGKRQCKSGTLLNIIVNRSHKLAQKEWNTAGRVAIFEDGHVLTGRFVKDSENKFQLKGTEMTLLGGAQKDFGRVADLKVAARALPIDHYIILETFDDVLTDKAKNAIIVDGFNQLKKNYGWPLDRLEKEVAKVNDGHRIENVSLDEITSPSFGKAKTSDKPSKMDTADELVAAGVTPAATRIVPRIVRYDYPVREGFVLTDKELKARVAAPRKHPLTGTWKENKTTISFKGNQITSVSERGTFQGTFYFMSHTNRTGYIMVEWKKLPAAALRDSKAQGQPSPTTVLWWEDLGPKFMQMKHGHGLVIPSGHHLTK